MEKVKVVFLSEGNCFRSQIAEGFAKKWGSDVMDAMSAGEYPDRKVKPEAVAVMKEVGIDISKQKPKSIDEIDVPDIAISMDSESPNSIQGVTCIEWSLTNPEGSGDAFFKRVRDVIASRVRVLIQDIKDGDLP